MTGAIHTVLGPVEQSAVTRVLPHEHIFCDFSSVTSQLNHVLNDREMAIQELSVLPGIGVNCVVDMTTEDFGRDPRALRQTSLDTGLHLVMGTGWYRDPYLPALIDHSTVDQLAQQIVVDLTVGVIVADATIAYAGIIGEIGVDKQFVSAREERVLRAAARASTITGAAVSTHTGVYPTGLAQLDLFREESLNMERVVIGHADMHLDRDYHREILQSGAYLQFDTAGRLHLNPDERRADFLMDLIRDGWLEKLLISSDRCFKSDLVAFGGAGYAHTLTTFADMLLARGLSTEELEVLTHGNPVKMLAWA